MTTTFEALAVNQGDAFLLRHEQVVLVDAGSNKQLIKRLLANANVERIDVLVCTHNDSDHSKGVPGVLDAVPVGEVWLPVEFLETLEASRRLGVEETVIRLRQMLSERGEPAQETARSTEIWGDSDSPVESVEATPVIRSVASHAEETRDRIVDEFGVGVLRRSYGGAAAREPDSHLLRSTADVMAAFVNIAEIAVAAHRNKVPVVWLRHLDHGIARPPYSRKGLCAINATQIASTRAVPLLTRLWLTPQNQRALVIRAEVDGRNDVLFCSDSPLDYPGKQLTGIGLFTAPHHGSPSNDRAYQWLPTSTALVVRSDHKVDRGDPTPTKEYAPGCTGRACTICRGAGRPARNVLVSLSTAGWSFAPGVRRCGC